MTTLAPPPGGATHPDSPTHLDSPTPTTAPPASTTLTATVAGLYDVLGNTVRATGTDPAQPMLARMRLHVADARLHAAATDRYRLHHDWTPLLDNAPAALGVPLYLLPSDVATLRAVLRRHFPGRGRRDPATLTVGPAAPNTALRPLSLAVGPAARPDTLTVAVLADPAFRFPNIAAARARMPGWAPTVHVRVSPRFLTDAGRITDNGVPAGRHGLDLRFRAAPDPRDPRGLGAVRVTSTARPSWAADIMPIAARDGGADR